MTPDARSTLFRRGAVGSRVAYRPDKPGAKRRPGRWFGISRVARKRNADEILVDFRMVRPPSGQGAGWTVHSLSVGIAAVSADRPTSPTSVDLFGVRI